jgi:hypothetical protein
MTNKARRFELVVLRPVHVGLVVLVLVCLLQGMWWWLGGCIIGLFYLGCVGASLHPLQSGSDLAQGPTEGPAAQIESELLPAEVVGALVGRACTGVGIFFGLTVGALLWGAVGWSWYVAIPLALVATLLTGGTLKVTFLNFRRFSDGF